MEWRQIENSQQGSMRNAHAQELGTRATRAGPGTEEE